MTSTVAQLAPDLPHGLAGSLAGVVQELLTLQVHMLRMQDVCNAPDLGSALDAVVIRELQGLDLVSQRLEALSGFVDAVIEALPFDPALDLTAALGAIPLHDLAKRLAAQAEGQNAPAPDDPSTGDFDLF